MSKILNEDDDHEVVEKPTRGSTRYRIYNAGGDERPNPESESDESIRMRLDIQSIQRRFLKKAVVT